MEQARYYRRAAPLFLFELSKTPEMQRLRSVGMNCGCEYTSFPLFRDLGPYSRYDHSLGAARIVWDFTQDAAQTIAALLHDIATPTFAHSVDFLHGDHLQQGSTESETEHIIRASDQIYAILRDIGVTLDEVVDYHIYPIADNETPRLSADRLEYTLGNLRNYGFCKEERLRHYYEDMTVTTNELGDPELAFQSRALASGFARDALRCSKVYVSPEDRYAMQRLAELLADAICRGVLCEADLYRTEPEVIAALCADPICTEGWTSFRGLHRMLWNEEEAPEEHRREIPAKKRCIDPLVKGEGRVSALDPDYADDLTRFLQEPQDRWLCAE